MLVRFPITIAPWNLGLKPKYKLKYSANPQIKHASQVPHYSPMDLGLKPEYKLK
jgi:hypothetical protein